MPKVLWNKFDFLILNDTPKLPLGIHENQMAAKNLVLELQLKMLSTNQIT